MNHQGLIDYQKIVDTIVETSWKGVLAFEVRGRSFNQSVKDVTKLFEDAQVIKCA